MSRTNVNRSAKLENTAPATVPAMRSRASEELPPTLLDRQMHATVKALSAGGAVFLPAVPSQIAANAIAALILHASATPLETAAQTTETMTRRACSR